MLTQFLPFRPCFVNKLADKLRAAAKCACSLSVYGTSARYVCLSNRHFIGFREHSRWHFSKLNIWFWPLRMTGLSTLFYWKSFKKYDRCILFESQLIIQAHIICTSCENVENITRFLLEYVKLNYSLRVSYLLGCPKGKFNKSNVV